MSEWLYKGQPFTTEMIGTAVGFVYLITNLDNGKLYIGKKLFTRSKSYQKNKKRKKMRVESDWMEYTGSNDLLNEDVSKGANLHKEILHLCFSKGWMSYLETKEILNRDAIISDNYYNSWISCKIRGSHLTVNK